MKAAANKVSNHSWVSALLMKQSKWLCHSWDSSVIVLLLRLGLITQEHLEIIPWPLPQEQLWPKYLARWQCSLPCPTGTVLGPPGLIFKLTAESHGCPI